MAASAEKDGRSGAPGYVGGYLHMLVSCDWVIKTNDDSKILYNSHEGDRTKMSTPLSRVQI